MPFEKQKYPSLNIKNLPTPPHWSKALGVGIVAMGLAIGTGELILWPHLVTKHGLGLLWAALLGITFQYFINQEVGRHTLATGESFFTTSARILKWFAPLWLVSAVVLYIWPGWAAAMGTTLAELFGFGNYMIWAWVSLALVLVLTFSGKSAYLMLEKSLKVIIPAFFVLLVVTSFLILDASNVKEVFFGLINFGRLPSGIDTNVLMSAIVFAGAGGLLNLCISLWYRDKKVGMAHYAGHIVNPITGKNQAVSAMGQTFKIDTESLKHWKRWMLFVKIDQGVIFYFLGLVTLILLSVNAYVVLTPKGLVPQGLDIAVTQANIFGEHWGKFGFNLFLVMAFLMLFSVMWTITDAVTRIVSDILFVNSQVGPFQRYLSQIKKYSIHKLYYTLIVVFVLISASLVPLKQPLVLLTISAILGGVSMAIYTPVLLYANNTKLPKPLRPGVTTNIALVLASVFYIAASIFIFIKNVF